MTKADKEIAQRRDAALRRAMNTPPTPHGASQKAKPAATKKEPAKKPPKLIA